MGKIQNGYISGCVKFGTDNFRIVIIQKRKNSEKWVWNNVKFGKVIIRIGKNSEQFKFGKKLFRTVEIPKMRFFLFFAKNCY